MSNFTFSQGWNLVSSFNSDVSFKDLFAKVTIDDYIDNDNEGVYEFTNNGTIQSYNTLTDLDSKISVGTAYFVYTPSATTIDVDDLSKNLYQQHQFDVTLNSGWNMLSSPFWKKNIKFSDLNFYNSIDDVLQYNEVDQKFENVDKTLSSMQYGRGYMIYLNKNVNSVIVNTSVSLFEANGNDITYSGGNFDLSLSGTVQMKLNEGAFVNGDKTKLDNIASGAEVNVIVDWNSSSGDSQILNKPTIPDVRSFITASSSDTLTNKTFDCNAAGNSISNIENADISSTANINISKTDLDSVTSQQVTDKVFIANQNAAVNFKANNPISVNDYGLLFNSNSSHALSHIQIHDGDNNSHSMILTAGGSKLVSGSGANIEIFNIQAYNVNNDASGARLLSLQRLGGSTSFGNGSLPATIGEDSVCTNFNINCVNNTITNIQESTVADGSTLDALLTSLSVRISALESAPKIFAACKYDGFNDTIRYSNNIINDISYPVRMGIGHYKFQLITRHSSDNYVIVATIIEAADKDTVVQVVSGEQKAETFEIIVNEDANGTHNAGTPRDRIVMFLCVGST